MPTFRSTRRVAEATGVGRVTALVAPGQQPVLPHRSGLAAGQTPRLGDSPLGDQRHGRVDEHLEVPLDPLAADGLPGTAAPPSQPVPEHSQRKRTLQRLDGGIPRVREFDAI